MSPVDYAPVTQSQLDMTGPNTFLLFQKPIRSSTTGARETANYCSCENQTNISTTLAVMEVQEQLDRQFGLQPPSTPFDPLESNSIAMSEDDSIQSSRDKTAESAALFPPSDDQATTTAMNDLALKNSPQQNRETSYASRDNNSSNFLESRQTSVLEPAKARSRKRKSPEASETEIAPPAPSKHKASGTANRPVTKTVSVQLSRPSTNPLGARNLQQTNYNSTSGNRFDIPDDDPTPEVLPRKPERPTGQVTKARGRPPKKTPGALPNKEPIADRALVPQVTHPESSLHLRPQTRETVSNEQSSLFDLGGRTPTDESASYSANVPDNVLRNEEDTGESAHVENDGGQSSKENSNDQDRSSEAAVSDCNAKPSHNNVSKDSDRSRKEKHFLRNEDESDSENEREIELFGGKEFWDLVIEGAGEVGVSKRKGKVVVSKRKGIVGVSKRKGDGISEKPEIATDTGKELVRLMQELKSQYKKVGSLSDGDPNHETMEDELRDLWEELTEAIDKISEPKASEDKLVQDIYSHAIPSMVFMLRAALICRSRHYAEPDDIESLKEIVEIQAEIVHFCEKARAWEVKPTTNRGAVTKEILPKMRRLKEQCFGRELADRTNVLLQRSREAAFAENYKNVCEQRKLQREQHHQQVLERRRMMFEQFEERPRARGSRPQQKSHVDEISKAHSRNHSITSDQWTRQQNEDLVDRLLSGESRDLPGMPALDL